MGANFATLIVNSIDRSEVRRAFEAEQDRTAYDYGHSYSGELNMAPGLTLELSTELESEDAALEFLASKAQKWENAIAVTFKDKNGQKATAIGAWCSC
jgi:hypothetical protein